MADSNALARLYDTTFLLGPIRRHSAIKVLAESNDVSGVLALAEALVRNHPDAARIAAVLRGLTSEADASKVAALWGAWARDCQRQPGLAEVLADLGWPGGLPASSEVARAVLALPWGGASSITKAITRFSPHFAVLARSDNPADVSLLAARLDAGHPSADVIRGALLDVSPQRDANKLLLLWRSFAQTPKSGLGEVLARLGWPPGQQTSLDITSRLLAIAERGAQPTILNAIHAYARSLDVADPNASDAICAAWVRSCDARFGALIVEQNRVLGDSSIAQLAEAITNRHSCANEMAVALSGLSTQTHAQQIGALWQSWAKSPSAPLASVLASKGWPSSLTADPKTIRDILAIAMPESDGSVVSAVASFARALPVEDEATNDVIFGAWIRSRSDVLETLITEQGRQPESPALEALHALVTGRLDRYVALEDVDGMLLVQAFALAPEAFRARIAKVVAASTDRRLKEAYRRALSTGNADAAFTVENLKLVGDEDGLFELARSLRLIDLLELCERWAESTARPTGARQREVVDRAVAAYRQLGQFSVEPGPPLPEGLVDIFEWWRRESRSDGELRADLNAPDPFHRARGLYLGRERTLVDDARLRAAATSDDWPERLIARLLDPSLLAEAKEDHVFWVSACAGDASVLQLAVGGTPEDYARNTVRQRELQGAAASRTRALLEILCLFQGAFIASGITVDESTEATDQTAVEIEDAPRVDF